MMFESEHLAATQHTKHHLEKCSNSQRQVVLVDEIEGKPREQRVQGVTAMVITFT